MQFGSMTGPIKAPIEEKLDFIQSLGMDVWHPASNEVDKEDLGLVKEMAAARGLGLSALAAGVPMSDPAKLEDNLRKWDRSVEIAVALGIPVLFSRAFPKPEGVGDEDAWRACIECSRYMARKAADSGVKFAFETDHFNFIDTLEGTQRLLAEVGPDMWINFDPCNFYFGGAKPMEVIEALYDRFVHGHVKDCFDTPEGPKEAPVGQGVIPYDTIFAELKKRGWNGAMCIEHCKDKECVAAAWKHVQAMRKIAGV